MAANKQKSGKATEAEATAAVDKGKEKAGTEAPKAEVTPAPAKGRLRAKRGSLSKKEQLFCRCMALLGNQAEAAVQAGYPPQKAAATAAALCGRPAIRREIAAWRRREAEKEAAALALAGLKRMAFSAANDAVRPVCGENPPEAGEMAGLDLFCVSEMKRTRDGNLEVRFFDRAKALEALLAWGEKADNAVQNQSFYAALEKSTAALRDSEAPGAMAEMA